MQTGQVDENDLPAEPDYPDEPVGDWSSEPAQYQWDGDTEEVQSEYRTNAVRSLEQGYTERRRIYASRVIEEGSSTSFTKTDEFRAFAGVVDKSAEPIYDHRARQRSSSRPRRPRDENRTISGYWYINGVKAHCLLDSGCEGVMVSPNFVRATRTKTFTLERPIGLQLACVGSKSTINYGTNTTIVFGSRSIMEYFDVANVDYYDAILGTPFLRRLGIVLDFNGPGHIRMGDEIIPNGANALPQDEEARKPRASTAKVEVAPDAVHAETTRAARETSEKVVPSAKRRSA